MKVRNVFLFALTTALGSSQVHHEQPRGERLPRQAPPFLNLVGEPEIDRINSWYDAPKKVPRPYIYESSRLSDPFEICAAFHGLAWTTWSLFETVSTISQSSNESVFQVPKDQGGPIVVSFPIHILGHAVCHADAKVSRS
jgi:hypothetical protein